MKIGIVGWGVYIPRFRIKAEVISKIWGYPETQGSALMVSEKAVEKIFSTILSKNV